MRTSLEVLFAPAEFAALPNRDLSETVCVVFDIFRATSTIVTALANGAAAIIPVAEIPEALAIRKERPDVLLAGERDGLRIRANLTGGIDFDFGNSPREFAQERIGGKTIVLSTTNGSRALRACAQAKAVVIGSFLNLRATAEYLQRQHPAHLLLVCSGTVDQASYEDVLGAGALADLLYPSEPIPPGNRNDGKLADPKEEMSPRKLSGLISCRDRFLGGEVADSAMIALQIYEQNRPDLLKAAEHCRNGRRLLSMPDLRDDVAWCLQRDRFQMAARLDGGSVIKLAGV